MGRCRYGAVDVRIQTIGIERTRARREELRVAHSIVRRRAPTDADIGRGIGCVGPGAARAYAILELGRGIEAAAESFCVPIRTMRFVSSAQVSDVLLSAPICVQVSGSAESSWKKPQVKSVTFGAATIYPAFLA